jgi:glycolate oxidase
MSEQPTSEHQALLEKAERQAQVVKALGAFMPAHALLWHREDTTPFECDGLTAYRQRPLVVALPETIAQVRARDCLAGPCPTNWA